MSNQVTEAHVVAFRDGITHRAQQMESRLREGFTVDPSVTGKSVSFDYIGLRTPHRRTTRHGDTEYSDTPHDRRWCDLVVWDDADLVDEPDKVRMLSDPTNPYSVAMARGFGRKIDEVGMDGAIGATRTGEEGTGTSAAPSNVFQEAGTDGMTLAKIISNKRVLDASEQSMNRWWAITARQAENMFNINEIRSSDFNVLRVLAMGQLNEQYMGFMWRRVEDPILKLRAGTTDKRQTVIWTRESVGMAFGMNPQASIDRLPGKNNSTQVFYSADFGACRLDDNGVIVQECHEA